MKRLFFTILMLACFMNSSNTSFAGVFSPKKTEIKQVKVEKNVYKEIERVLEAQGYYAEHFDIDGLKSLYTKDFVNSDGFSWDVYFSLIEETWKTYPDITYKYKIEGVTVDGNYATVRTSEESVATTSEEFPVGKVFGELNSSSECIYYLKKIGDTWLISGEQILREKSALKFGTARFVKMTFDTPQIVGAGEVYTSSLKVHVPADTLLIGAMSQSKIVNPIEEPDKKFRAFADDKTITRMFTANEDNVNEYNAVAVAITEAAPVASGDVKVYMSGLAFVMTRINVVPKNNFAKVDVKVEAENEQKSE